MGAVYVAEEIELRREVAPKALPPEMAGHRDRRQRFEQEARAVAGLTHPDVLTRRCPARSWCGSCWNGWIAIVQTTDRRSPRLTEPGWNLP